MRNQRQSFPEWLEGHEWEKEGVQEKEKEEEGRRMAALTFSTGGVGSIDFRQGESSICSIRYPLVVVPRRFPFEWLQTRAKKGNLASAFSKLIVFFFPSIHFPYLFTQDKNTGPALPCLPPRVAIKSDERGGVAVAVLWSVSSGGGERSVPYPVKTHILICIVMVAVGFINFQALTTDLFLFQNIFLFSMY